jgi:hypothetical protein
MRGQVLTSTVSRTPRTNGSLGELAGHLWPSTRQVLGGTWPLAEAHPKERVGPDQPIRFVYTHFKVTVAVEDHMCTRVLGLALALTTAAMWLSLAAATARSQPGRSPWLKTESRRFEIHYQRPLAPDLDRVVRSAESAYDRITARLRFVLDTKVPLIVFAASGPMTQEQVAEYAASDQVTPPQPHRSRLVLPLPAGKAQLDALMVHELAHLLMCEIILPGRGGDGNLPRWVHEGLAAYMVGIWVDVDERLMRELVASGHVPALSNLTSSGEFADAHVNDALGHLAFDYIDSRWGPSSIRGFLNALNVPRVDKTYDAVFDLTPAEFDTAFRHYAERRFGRPVH